MGQGWNDYIVGTCLSTVLNNNMRLFRTITAHVAFNSPTGNNYKSGVFTCGQNKSYYDGTPFTPYYGTQQIPDFYTPPSGSIFRASYLYNQSNQTVGLNTFDGEPVYFCENELEFWRKRPMFYPSNPYQVFASGPAVQSSHAWDILKRKRNDNNRYVGRYNYNFLDYSQPIIPTTSSTTTEEPPATSTTTPEPEPPPCQINDFLIYMHPATPLWTNLPEPFVATENFEQSGSVPPRDSYYGGKNFMPFCSPLNVRDGDGNILGQYIGYTFSFIFGQANMAFPVRPYLPPDPNSPLPNPPPVNPRQAFYSLEMLVYLASNNDQLASPCIGKKRFWMYSNAGLSGGFQWFTPYFDMLLGPMNSMWIFDVQFNYYTGGGEAIEFNLSDCNVLVGA